MAEIKAEPIQPSQNSNEEESQNETDPTTNIAIHITASNEITQRLSKANVQQPDEASENDDIGLDRRKSVPLEEEEEEEEENFGYIPEIEISETEALILSTVLEDLEDQSMMIRHLFPSAASPGQISEFLTYEDRFKREVSEKEMEFLPKLTTMQNPFDTDGGLLHTSEERNAKKLQTDLMYFDKLVVSAKRELDDARTFKYLKAHADRQPEWKRTAIALIDRYHESQVKLMDLCKTMVTYSQEMCAEENDRKEIINFLKDKLHLTIQQGKQDQRYIRAFHEARNDHNLNILNHQLQMTEENMKALEIDMARDKFCHRNVEDYFELVFWDTQKNIDTWNTKFEKDLESMDKQVREKQDSIRSQQIQIESLNRIIEERMVELGPWEDQQRREKELRADYLRLYFNARKIQRWWRAYMVKHKLYKKKKGKKGKESNVNVASASTPTSSKRHRSADSRILSADTAASR